MKNILLVEDDQTLLSVLKYSLTREGYDVLTAEDGVEALQIAQSQRPDLVILDIMLPKLSGFEVCRILRKSTTIPIIMLTARDEEVDKIVGLEIGADDYMTKPFSMRELIARVRALLRRAETASPESPDKYTPIKLDDLEIDLARHQITLAGSRLEMTPKEFDLLAFLASHQRIVFNRDQLLDKVWGYGYAGDTRTVDVHIRWLREKIEKDPKEPRRLVTVRGIGYKMEG
ncbi:MAG: response regulator transcription factor [Dehalococcoidales bacterium]|nr:response regulator transcription factor [Dehalococcoidales bacterium]